MTNPQKPARKKRPAHQVKQVKPGHKSMRGVAETIYGELKKLVTYSLTPTCQELLKELSRKLGCSVSEVLERLSRKQEEIIRLLESEE